MHNYQAKSPNGPAAGLIVAGGSAQRMGIAIPKQFQMLGGRTVLDWSVQAMLQAPEIARVVIVVPGADVPKLAGIYAAERQIRVVAGGASRTESVRSGFSVLTENPPACVLIHDAARPGLSQSMISSLIAALETAAAAVPALPMSDAIKRTLGDDRLETQSRDGLLRVQTPQAFRYEVIAAAYAAFEGEAVDDLALIENTATIRTIPGDIRLMKITWPEDMAIAERLLMGSDMRIGSGFDVHAFTAGDAVTLCGVRVPHTHKLSGHSDADAGWHALTDAILGALALGDIGDHFPPSDPQWKGADSRIFLARAVELAHERGYRIANADLTLICEAPKIGPHRDAMRAATAEVLGVAIDVISVKATTTETLGFTGRGEGIAAQATVMLSRI